MEPSYSSTSADSNKPASAGKQIEVLLAKHPHAVLYGFIGLAAAILILTIGLGATLLLAVLIGIGVIIGQYRDGDSRIRLTLNRLMQRLS